MSGFTINDVTLSGNLTRDPEVRTIPASGTTVCKLRLASNERYKNNDTGEWADRPGYYDVTVWKGLGEWLGSNLKKGDGIVVHGRLRWREWEADDGSKRQGIDIVANDIVPITRDGRGGGGGRGGYEDSDADIPIDTADLPPVGAQDAAIAGDSDDIPF